MRWPNLSLAFANRAGQVMCPLGRSSSTIIKIVNFATASPCIPSEKEIDVGGSWTKWGVPFRCGLLATYFSRVRIIQSGKHGKARKKDGQTLKNFAQTTRITTQTILPAFNFLEIQFPFKPKTTTKQGVL